MPLFFLHPSLERIVRFVSDELSAEARAHTGRHLQSCVRCQGMLRFVRSLDAAGVITEASPPLALRQRILDSRAAGNRVILPAPVTAPPRRRWTGAMAGIAVAAGVLLMAWRVMAPGDALGVSERSTLVITPATPTRAAAVQVHYRPGPMMFPDATALVLRARIRTVRDQAYGVPPTQVRRLAVLHRDADGSFTARLTLPDSMVFAVFAVESPDSSRVDDNDGRGWELPVAELDGRPAFDALYQRAHDMMGRSWEQGYASMQRATELYPDRVEGWTYREFFERALYMGSTADSVMSMYRARLDSLVAFAKTRPRLRYEEIGSIYFRAYVTGRRPGATRADSAEWAYWWDRLRAEYPRHEQRAQRLAVYLDTAGIGRSGALDSLEHLYHAFAPLSGPGRNLFNRATQLVDGAKDPTADRRWLERIAAGAPDSVRRVAMVLSTRPAFRQEGMELLRALLRDSTAQLVPGRALEDDAATFARRVADQRRRMLAALGRALIAQGRRTAALDTLRLASSGTWDPVLFGDLAGAYRLAGDAEAASRMGARLVVDPRTTATRADSLEAEGRRRLGASGWNAALDTARRDMHDRLLERSIVRSVRTDIALLSRNGRTGSVRSLTGGRPAVVIFWSRQCGFAIEAVPEIASLVTRLGATGTPVLFVIGETPSVALDDALAALKVTWPVYYDTRGLLADAMNNFATPSYYVLDGAGRIRFNFATEVPDIIAQVEAVKSEAR